MANLTADVKTTELDVFEKIVGLYREILEDTRIDVKIREEYQNKATELFSRFE
mgnify:CR=1 FL=1